MQRTPRLPLLALTLAAALAATAGCATRTSTLGAGGASTSAAAAATLPANDRAFIAIAAGSGLFEVEAGKLAMEKARSPEVKGFGRMLVEHHQMANNELMALARSKNALPPAALPPDLQAKLAGLSRLSGDDFDREFIRTAGVQAHVNAIAQFEQGRRTVADRDLQAWIAKTLPTLQQHLRSAQDLAGRMAG